MSERERERKNGTNPVASMSKKGNQSKIKEKQLQVNRIEGKINTNDVQQAFLS